MTDVLEQMQIASWRGIEFPVSDRDFGFQHEQSQLRFLFQDDQIIESLGRENPTYRYTIPFREDIVKGPFENLFVDTYPQFLDACLDRTNGTLIDPAHGAVQVKCQSLQETLSSDKRDGVDVVATFVTSPDEDFELAGLGAQITTLQGAQDLAGFFDRDATQLDDATKKRLAALNAGSGQGTISPLDIGTAALDQVNLVQNKLLATVGQVADKAERLDKSLGRLKEPKAHSLRNTLRRLEQTSRNLVDHATGSTVGKNATVRSYLVPADIGPLALASVLHTSISDFNKLNPSLARALTIKKGTRVLYFITGDFATFGSLASSAAAVPVARTTLGV